MAVVNSSYAIADHPSENIKGINPLGAYGDDGFINKIQIAGGKVIGLLV